MRKNFEILVTAQSGMTSFHNSPGKKGGKGGVGERLEVEKKKKKS